MKDDDELYENDEIEEDESESEDNDTKADDDEDESEDDVKEDDEEEKVKHKNKSKTKSSNKNKSGSKTDRTKKKKRKIEEDDDDEYDEYEDEDDDEDDDSNGSFKIIILAIIIAALIAVCSFLTYEYFVKQDTTTTTEQSATITPVGDVNEVTDAEETVAEETPTVEETATPTPEPTATSKPLPTATPTPTPFPDEAEEAVISNDDSVTANDTSAETQEIADIVYLGDLRFRSMANVATGTSDRWECSATGDYSWMTGTAFSDVDKVVGDGTQVFISMGINDLLNYQSYASAISSKAAEWETRGAKTYFVSVGPVDATSDISNTDICTFNTYMYNNLSIPFVDVYNYLVENGFTTTDGKTYADTTSTMIYNYLNSLIGR